MQKKSSWNSIPRKNIIMKVFNVKLIQTNLIVNFNLHWMFLEDYNYFFNAIWFFMFRIFAIVVTTLNGFLVTFKFIPWKSLILPYFKPPKNLYLDPQNPISKS